MDRTSTAASPSPRGKPHARGDGPGRPLGFGDCGRQAPRTWGWTAERVPVGGDHDASPTHVGMDRCGRTSARSARGKPHARGDGPANCASSSSTSRRAPRTWGWTVGRRRRPPRRPASPTHVGMDRGRQDLRRLRGREPHARGDGPLLPAHVAAQRERASRTWGWTVGPPGQAPQHRASPTHVGMDRQARLPPSGPAGEPHARGDGPVLETPTTRPAQRAPRTWGWTGNPPHVCAPSTASPTHVGMDRRTPRGRRQEHPRSPRTWGWTAGRVPVAGMSSSLVLRGGRGDSGGSVRSAACSGASFLLAGVMSPREEGVSREVYIQ